MSAKPEGKKRIGDELVRAGIISLDQLKIALLEQRRSGIPLGQLLTQLGFVTEAIMRDSLSEILGQDSIDLKMVVPDPDAIALIPKAMVMRHNVIPISYDSINNLLILAMADIYDLMVLDRIRATIDATLEIEPMLAGKGEIAEAIDTFYGYELSVDGILHEIETGEIDHKSVEEAGDEYSQPLVRLVDAILTDAVKQGASDIHFEPEASFLRLRYRIDGVLKQIRSLHKNYWSAIVVRLKVISNMNIAETRAPQDGRISLSVLGRKVDFRVSAQPTTHGENIVLRVLDREKGIVPLANLDIPADTLNALKLMMARPEGIILVTGPTGSGKTTTLYSMISYRKSEDVNIMTLEDPVEYPMDMIRQTSINEVAKMDFASGIRSLMRQDPDIILVGEVRDESTAEMAFRAAMTGHQVFTTLHTNSAIGAIPRLIDIGVKADILAGNVIGILGQRLVRRLCSCKVKREINELELQFFSSEQIETNEVYDPVGCSKCGNSGYKGRLSVLEVLTLDFELDEMIADRASTSSILAAAKKKGYRTMADEALNRVATGATTLDEVSRVIDFTQYLNS